MMSIQLDNINSVGILHSYKSDIHMASDADDLIGEYCISS